ncbi:MAG: M50 family metallopeptidase [Cohaesibacteraceae bacterium]|nr:M50 family metallopeptidase [Cohaesibacteraceae bacterium]
MTDNHSGNSGRASFRGQFPTEAARLLAKYGLVVEIFLVLFILLFWQSVLITPLKILVVFFHEFSHALMAWATGGSVSEFVLVAHQGGHIVSRGGSAFLIMSAGYLGSLLWGVVLYQAARRTSFDRYFLGGIGGALVAIAALYGLGQYLMWFGFAMGGVFIAISIFLPNVVSDVILRIVGLVSMAYVPLDILSDTITRSTMTSDAYNLGQKYFGGAMFWGGLWLVISVIVIGFVLRRTFIDSRG